MIEIELSTEEITDVKNFVRQKEITGPDGKYLNVSKVITGRIKRAIAEEVSPYVE